MSKKYSDIITTLCGYIDAIDNEAKKTLPDVIDQKFMLNANPQEISLVKILLMVFRCNEAIAATVAKLKEVDNAAEM